MLAIEEPETHLHPQAQRAIFGQIEQINSQTIISSHSPYVCSLADVKSFILFAKTGNETQVSHFDDLADDLNDEDHRKIRREVMNTRGDLLFSRCMVLFEGETEEQALPAFAYAHWGKHIHELGYSFVAVGGKDAYTPFLRLAKRFGISWKIFSDGAQGDIDSVNKCLTKAGEKPITDNPHVVLLPFGMDFEAYMSQPQYLDALRTMIVDYRVERDNHNEQGQKALQQTWASKSANDIQKELRNWKTVYGARFAKAFSTLTDEAQRIPAIIRDLLDAVKPPVATSKEIASHD